MTINIPFAKTENPEPKANSWDYEYSTRWLATNNRDVYLTYLRIDELNDNEVKEKACGCQDYQIRKAIENKDCKHITYLKQMLKRFGVEYRDPNEIVSVESVKDNDTATQTAKEYIAPKKVGEFLKHDKGI